MLQKCKAFREYFGTEKFSGFGVFGVWSLDFGLGELAYTSRLYLSVTFLLPEFKVKIRQLAAFRNSACQIKKPLSWESAI